jgi:nucleoside-diphosphate-sugar epimerase
MRFCLEESKALPDVTLRGALSSMEQSTAMGWLDGATPAVKDALDVRLGDIRVIPYSYRAPESFVDTSVRGTLNVLEAARRAKVGRVIHTSTSEVYGTPHSTPIRETHPLQAQSPYAATKVSIGELFEIAKHAVGVEATVKTDERRLRPDASEVLVLESDPAYAKQKLGWEPTTSLEEGLKRTAAWLNDHLGAYGGVSFHV